MPETFDLLDHDPPRIGPYRLLGRLGEGGQGVVYLGEDESDGPNHGRRVAVKVLHPDLVRDEEARTGFLREVDSARRVPQFFTARVLDHGMDPSGPFVVSELVEGRSLYRTVKGAGPYDPDSLLRLAMGTASALATIHAAGVVHRDFKPSNVMLGPDGPRVIDFGTARSIDLTTTRTSGLIGTLPYMSPEQASGEHVGPASDMFSWAVTLVFAATGEPVFGRDFPAVLNRIINTEPDLPALPEPLDRLVPGCLAKDPQRRPTAAQAMLALVGQADAADILDRHAQGRPAPVEAAAAPGPAPSTRHAERLDAVEAAADTDEATTDVVASADPPATDAEAEPAPAPQPSSSAGATTHPGAGETGPAADEVETDVVVPADALPTDARAEPAPVPGRRSRAGRTSGRRRRRLGVVAAVAAVLLVGATAALALQLPGSGPTPTSPAGAPAAGPPSEFDAASTGLVNPGEQDGGLLRVGVAPVPPSPDPGTMAPPELWNLARLYSRSLVTWSGAADPENGAVLVPDLAEDLGEVSDDGLTWTYRIREDAMFEDGTPVTAHDVAHAVERSYELGDWTYSPDRVSGEIVVPDDHTVEFHLGEPFAEFDYLMATAQSAPVPEDAGDDPLDQVLASGPYRIAHYEPGEALTLEPNPEWSSETDPYRRAAAGRVSVVFADDPEDLADPLFQGSLDTMVSLGGLPHPQRERVLGDVELLSQADAPYSGALSYVAVSTAVEPFDDPECRAAVRHAVDRGAAVDALGGELAATPAGAVLTPRDVGHQDVPVEPADPDAARAALDACGQGDGFAATVAVRGDVPGDAVLAARLGSDLATVGIDTRIREYSSDEFVDTAGSPDHAEEQGLALTVFTHRPWWPTGRFALVERVHGDWIRDSGNLNFSLLDDEHVNDLLEEATQEHDSQARSELYAELDELLRDEAVLVPLAYPRTVLWRPERLTDVYAHPVFGGYDLAFLGVTE